MRAFFLCGLLLLASCAGQDNRSVMTEQPSDAGRYQTDVAYCKDWAAPTRHEWAERCAANGEMVMASHIIASLSGDDPRDHDTERQSMPNDTKYRFDMCLQTKGYKTAEPGAIQKVAAR